MVEIQGALIDVDRTLLYTDAAGHDVITPEVVGTIQFAEELGIAVLPATSRSLHLMGNVHQAINFRHCGVLDNGASVYDFAANRYVAMRWLPADLVQAVAAGVKDHCRLLSCGSTYNPLPPREIDVSRLGEAPTVFVEYPTDKEDRLLAALGELAGEIEPPKPMHTPNRAVHCVQVTLPGVNKLTGARIALRHDGLEGARLLAVGDNTHDEHLFEAVGENGIKVPMGDAPPGLIRLASQPPVADAEHNGLVDALLAYAIRPRLLEP